MAGNGTIGLELVEDAPEFDTVIVPWGGGGLTTGIASALKALRPEVRVVTAEPETGAPLPLPSRPVSRARSSSGPRGSTAPAAARCCRGCGSAHASSSTRPWPCRSPRSKRPSGCSPRAPRRRGGSGRARACGRAAADDRCVCIVQRREHRRRRSLQAAGRRRMRRWAVSPITDLPVVSDGEPDDPVWYPLQHALGIDTFGANVFVAREADHVLVEEHDELGSGQQELYLVLDGSVSSSSTARSCDSSA